MLLKGRLSSREMNIILRSKNSRYQNADRIQKGYELCSIIMESKISKEDIQKYLNKKKNMTIKQERKETSFRITQEANDEIEKISSQYALPKIEVVRIILNKKEQELNNPNIINDVSDIQKIADVYKILIMSIEVIGNSESGRKIYRNFNKILTTQTYWPTYTDKRTGGLFRYDFSPDPDMSDFACDFYNIIYKKNIVDGRNGNLINYKFAGDTMNSFHTIANLYSDSAGSSKAKRTDYDTWPSNLQEYYNLYHSLANFWLLPLEIGRKNNNSLSKGSYENGIKDYMDRFLKRIAEEKDLSIFSVASFHEFCEKNFLIGPYVYPDDKVEVFSFSENIESRDKILDYVIRNIKLRALLISKLFYNELWSYFNKFELIDSRLDQ